jgi:hypothetical protein
MAHNPARVAVAAVALLTALAGGCGGLGDEPQPRRDAAAAVADSSPASPDTKSLLPDTLTAHPDAFVVPDGNAPDPTAVDAGGGASLDSDVETGPEPFALDAGPQTRSDGGAGPEAPLVPPVGIVVLPDTQYYAAAYPEVFAGQIDWIRGQKPALNLAAVLHVGDLVDGDTADQWSVASKEMHKLDGVLPYVVVPGNHDTDDKRKTMMNSYFGPSSMPWITGTMVAGQMENNYALLTIGPQQWLVLGLEFGPRDAVVAWADTVLKTYADRPAIIVTHAYLYNDGNRYDIKISGSDTTQPNYQFWIPQYYGFTASQGINDGEMLWQKLVLPNANVRFVFSGHVTGAARLTSARPDGSRVHQMLFDYQWFEGAYFGFGYLEVLQLDYGKKTITVETYSPYLQQYMTDDAYQFALDWNL